MKTRMLTTVLVILLALAVGQGQAESIGTEFTYQGRLIDANYPADDLYDFEFELYDDPYTGVQQGSTIYLDEVDVIDGYFTVGLDFGDVFDGDERWLQIGIRPGDMNDPNVYTTLEPRQEVTPTPYALYAKSAQTAGSDSDWMVDGDDMYSIPSGNIGIGTMEPGSKLHVYSPDNPTVLRLHSSAGFGAGKLEFWSNSQGSQDLWRPGSIISTDQGFYTGGLAFLVNGSGEDNKTNEIEVMRIVDGNVGIGIAESWGAKLHVQQGDSPSAFYVNTSPGADLSIKYGGSDEIVSIGSWTAGGLHFYSTCCGYTEPNDGSIQLYPRFGDAIFKGNVGIGPNSPSYKLDVAGPANLNKGSAGVALWVDGTEALWYDGTYFSWGFGGQRNYFANQVGIGTDSPQKTLDVSGDVRFGAKMGSGNAVREIQLVNYYGNDVHKISSKNSYMEINPRGTSDPLILMPDGGDVGIGTTEPSSTLEVASLYSGIRFHVSGYTPQIWFRDQGEHEWGMGCHYSDGSLRFSPDDLVGNAKVTLLQSGNVGIGTNSPGGKLHVSHDGTSPDFVVDDSTGKVGIGTDDPWSKLHVEGEILVNTSSGNGVHVENVAGHGIHVYSAGNHGFNVYSASNHGVNVADAGDDGVHVAQADDAGIDAAGTHGNHLRSDNSGYYGLTVHSRWDESGNPGLYVYGRAHATGNLSCGGTKPFIQPHPKDASKEIVYIAAEAPEAVVLHRGIACLKEGIAVIELPEHFRLVAAEEGVQVQVTPHSTDTFGLAVMERSREKIVVKELKNGKGNFGFDYIVTGIREGFEGHQPVTANTHFKPRADETAEEFEAQYAGDGMSAKAIRSMLISNGILTEEGKLNMVKVKELGWMIAGEDSTVSPMAMLAAKEVQQ